MSTISADATAFQDGPDSVTTLSQARRSRGLWADALRRLLRLAAGNHFCRVLLILLILAAIFAPLIAPYDYTLQDYAALTQPPSSAHLLGTDDLGRDILSRLLYGARISLSVGFVVQAVILLIGVTGRTGRRPLWRQDRHVHHAHGRCALLGTKPALHHRDHDLPARRVCFSQQWIHGGLVALDAQTGGLIGVFIGVGLVNWMPAARLVRGQAVSLKEKEYVEAARSLGANDRRIMLQHLLPNVVPIIVVTATIGIPQAHHLRGRHQLPGTWRASSNPELGPHDFRGDPQLALLPVHAGVAGAGAFVHRPRLQLPGRWLAGRG